MSKTKNTGFSLIEVLVSILIISIGLLGTSYLLIKGSSNAKTSSLRATAAAQASSLASSMYANNEFWNQRNQLIAFKTNKTNIDSISTNIITTKENCGNCTPAELAGADIKSWLGSLATALPEAKSEVNCPAVTTNKTRSCIIKITWTEHFFGGNEASESAATFGNRDYFLHIEL